MRTKKRETNLLQIKSIVFSYYFIFYLFENCYSIVERLFFNSQLMTFTKKKKYVFTIDQVSAYKTPGTFKQLKYLREVKCNFYKIPDHL